MGTQDGVQAAVSVLHAILAWWPVGLAILTGMTLLISGFLGIMTEHSLDVCQASGNVVPVSTRAEKENE